MPNSSQQRALEQAAAAFKQAWLDFFASGKQGESPSIEVQLAAWKQKHGDAFPDGEVFTAFLRAELDAHNQEGKTSFGRFEYHKRFPQFAKEIDALLPPPAPAPSPSP